MPQRRIQHCNRHDSEESGRCCIETSRLTEPLKLYENIDLNGTLWHRDGKTISWILGFKMGGR